jgi:transcriptional regulator with XRE-family HTH domain
VVAQREGGGVPRLADRINHLFATVPRPGGRGLWTNDDAAAAISEAGVPMSAAYLSQLRTGKRDNPSARHLAAIARLFEMPMEYFFNREAAEKIDADLTLLAAMREAGVRELALRAHGLSEDSLLGLVGMIERIRQLEQVPETDTDRAGRRDDPAGAAE